MYILEEAKIQIDFPCWKFSVCFDMGMMPTMKYVFLYKPILIKQLEALITPPPFPLVSYFVLFNNRAT